MNTYISLYTLREGVSNKYNNVDFYFKIFINIPIIDNQAITLERELTFLLNKCVLTGKTSQIQLKARWK